MNTCPTCGHEIDPTASFTVYGDTISLDGKKIPLTRTEMTIMEMLERAGHRGPVTNENLIEALYLLGADEPENSLNVLRVFICHLRKKLTNSRLRIVNHYNFGYSLVCEAREAA